MIYTNKGKIDPHPQWSPRTWGLFTYRLTWITGIFQPLLHWETLCCLHPKCQIWAGSLAPCLQECLLCLSLCFSVLEQETMRAVRGNWAGTCTKLLGPAYPCSLPQDFLICQLRVYSPCPIGFIYLVALGFLVASDCTIREEQLWIAEQWSCCEFWEPNASWVPLPTLFAQFRGSESGKITGCSVICRNQPAIAIPGCTTSLHPGKVSRE